MAYLEHPFRPLDVFQTVCAERLDGYARRQVIAAEVMRRLGEKHLPAVAGGEEARDPIERCTEIVAVAHFDCTRMKRHAHSQLRRFRPRLMNKRALSVERTGKGIGCRVKRRAKG